MIRKKKILSFFIFSLLTCYLFTNVQTIFASQQDPITILFNGEKLSFDVEPYIKEGRTLVPFRGILEALGAEVIWNPDERSVTARNRTTEIYLKIGSNETLVNGSKVIIDVPAEITDSRTFVPLRFISENLGATVLWDGATRTVSIEYKPQVLVEDPGNGEIPGNSGAIGVFNDGDITIIIDKVKFDSSEKKFYIYGRADFNGKSVFLRVFDSTGNTKMAEYVKIENQGKLKSFEAVVITNRSEYYPESILIDVFDEKDNKLKILGKIIL
ncbi:copper amine oxidase N-terminal domain-containing protein [Acetivibrio clariflavus]|uniref:Copper amine oxidase family protein n=1 Tax=Acetivibrio clariflavus (strain DSM 19732 / NBRC 101661 / EBR45) TaxID=720554 RepID=G8M184_ACECE|nr:copper amine oxidase N-terminal domain-containing protein [Acetivibrio clariflavus]AEV68060.1 copper amine oxidase family protein [Acetivibrio clariflavus DSM 19732]